MSKHIDKAPIPYTCPKIDQVISFINDILNEGTDEEVADFDIERKEILDVLESIRSDNETLREWGNELYNEKDALESECNDLEKKFKKSENEIEYLNKEMSTLQDQLYEYENNLD